MYVHQFGILIKLLDDMHSAAIRRDALISQIYFWNETLHVSDSFSVLHQEMVTVQIVDFFDIYHYCVYSGKLLMMDRGTVRNM